MDIFEWRQQFFFFSLFNFHFFSYLCTLILKKQTKLWIRIQLSDLY